MGIRERVRDVPRGSWIRLAAFAVTFAIAGLVLLLIGVPTVAEARDWVRARGPIAPVVFVVGFAALTVTPFPKSVLSVAGGALWGIGVGLAICVAAVVLGATFSFVLGRHVVGSSLRTLAGPHMKQVDDAVRRSFLAVLAVRIMPVLPFTLLNYAFGVTAIRYPVFALATAIGCTPGTGAYVAVGAYGADVTSWQFWVVLASIATVSLIAVILGIRRRGRDAAAADHV
ncbi:TVP38/TMEM64 family protein [Blastococcus sp. Marseille-P5729]|uniref:TVP38/TMEM64 family protein n=1 Tax=Blastococcus sp. Marseille-P5729 TaxID=2086582 RepID=UPI000D103092|nr:VTT domain-containing protein [Blastococcus sp. Marseille-P5729]